LAGGVHLALTTGGKKNMNTLHSQIEDQPNIAVQTLEQSMVELEDAVSRHLPSLYNRAYRYLGNSHDAEDAVQDALLSAYKHLDQFKGNARMTTWLTSIVTNSALTYLRRRPRLPHTSLDEPLTHDKNICLSDKLMDVRPNPEDACAMSQVHDHLMRIAVGLSYKSQKVIQLCGFNEMPAGEAAGILGVPKGTIKARLSRARSQLKRKAKLGLVRTSGAVKMHRFSPSQIATN
jgi:RNA polymerase sigma-70 factor (ECF subfamily)